MLDHESIPARAGLIERTVNVHVLRLRKALRDAKSLLKTVRGFGYKLSVSWHAAA